MGINISQFSPPATVSNLVWDDDMTAGAGKIFKGDLVGNVTGDVVGNITNGGVNGYLLRPGLVSASSGTLIVPAGSSEGDDTPVTITLNGSATWCIKDNIYKCFYPSPFTIPVSLSTPAQGYSYDNNAYAESYDADGVLIDSVGNGGNLNIYGASYIIINGGTAHGAGYENSITMSVANTYIDADTTVIPGMVPPITPAVFTRDVVGNVTGNVMGNVTGKTSYEWTMTPISGATTSIRVGANSEREFYNISPNGTITGTITIKKDNAGLSVYLLGIDGEWNNTFVQSLTSAYKTYTIAPNTSLLYVRNFNDSYVNVTFNKFTLT